MFASTTHPPTSSTFFPYTTLFRSIQVGDRIGAGTAAAEREFPPPTLEAVISARDFDERARLRAALAQLAEQDRSEEHTSELQSLRHIVCRLLLEKKKKTQTASIEK